MSRVPTPFETNTDLDSLAEAMTMAASLGRIRDPRDQMTPFQRMYDDGVQLRAANYEQGPKGSVHWCEWHEREVFVCHRLGHRCTGVPLSGPSDPTGEAAVSTPQGHVALMVVHNATEVIRVAVGEILDEMRAWQLMAYDAAKALTDGQDENENAKQGPWCEFCHRAGAYVPPEGANKRTCDGRLEEAVWACSWCQKWVRQTGLPPSLMVSEAHCSGAKVRAFERDGVIEAKTTTGTLVDRFPAPSANVEKAS